MFARGYFPGRSGQVFVVPSEGEVITERDPLYQFMHGSPWDYDTHIPILFYGAPFISKGERNEPVSQQDIAPTLGATHRRRAGADLHRPRAARSDRAAAPAGRASPCCSCSTRCAPTTSTPTPT